MENFLPALFIIGAIVYKIYTEYQKEQDKARRRISKTPVPSPSDETAVPPALTHQMNRPPIAVLARRNTRDSHRDQTAATLTTGIPKKTLKSIIDLDAEEGNERPASFDLREAVIQSAILHRPHQ